MTFKTRHNYSTKLSMREPRHYSFSGAIDMSVIKKTFQYSELDEIEPLQEYLVETIPTVSSHQKNTFHQDPQVLPSLFSRCAALTPDQIAVAHGDQTITYKEIDILSNQYANYLQTMHHIEHGDMVCIAYDRGIYFVVAMLAILKCGGAYVPIDNKEPLQRRRDIIEDVSPKLALVQEEYRSDFGFKNCISIENLNIHSYSQDPKKVMISSEDIAVVFYTSGSTGRPKGVVLPHVAITGLICSSRHLNIDSKDRVLSSSSIAFDAATFEIWLALGNSATLVCIEYENIINPESFANFLDHEEITVVFITSALFDQTVAFKPDIFKKVRYLISGGDVVNPKTVYKVLSNKNGRPHAFINVYGPTETGIIATSHMISEMQDDLQPLPIGKAVADSVMYVLDEEQRPVTPGEQGELYIGGPRLAKGYLNLPERSAKSFIPNPLTGNPTDKLYRTGDLVAFLPDGSLSFHGRADRQIKFRGFRLELDGIENTLISYPHVANAAVKVIKLKGEKALVGYIQPEDPDIVLSVANYRAYLNEKLPAYSVPRFIIVMDKLPVTQRGKIDRKNLPDPVIDAPTTVEDTVSPRNETEKIIYNSWSKFLGLKDFSITDDFFDLGGSSVLLPSVYADIRKQTKPFKFEAFLKNPTIERLAELIETNQDEELRNGIEEAKADAILDANIQPSWDSTSHGTDTKSVLLTGATGFLGSHILLYLLENSDCDVFCLIRPSKSQPLLEDRLNSALDSFKINIPLEASKRIHHIAGDIAKPCLGLDAKDRKFIIENCSHIIHNGANVNHILPYARLKAANSESTNELIKIAMEGRQKKLSFISTCSAVTECNLEGFGYEDRVGRQPGHFFGGYATSKWVSERLMEQAFERGMDGSILRPGNIFANSKTEVTSPTESNFALLMMNTFLESGLAPDLNMSFEAVPVDQLARAIISMTLGTTNHAVLNLSNPEVLSLKKYVKILRDLKEGDIEIVAFREWKRRVIDQLPRSSPLYPLTLYFQDDKPPAEEILYFETELAQKELASHDVEYSKDYKQLLNVVVHPFPLIKAMGRSQ